MTGRAETTARPDSPHRAEVLIQPVQRFTHDAITIVGQHAVVGVDDDALLDGCDDTCAVVLEVDVGTFVIANWTVVATVRSRAPSEDAAVVAEYRRALGRPSDEVSP